MKIKSLTASIFAASLIFTLTACGSTPAAQNSTNSNSSTTSTPQKLVLATNAEFQPFEFVTEANKGIIDQYDGIDILIAKEIGKDLGCDIEIANMKFESILTSIDSGKAQIGLAGMTVTDERKKNVDFSTPYWVAVQTIIVPEGNTDITSAESLKGKRVGVVTGYTGDNAITKIGIQPTRFKKGIDAVMQLKNGKLDAVVIDSPTANRFIAKFQGLKGVNDDKAFSKEEYAIAVKKGNTDLLNKINKTIERLIANGDIDRFAEEVDSRLD